MKKICVMIMLLVVTGCGGGGGSTESTTVAQKTSQVDGSWNYSISNGLGGQALVENISFSNGNVTDTSYIGTVYSYMTGTFIVAGNTLTCNYTSSNMGNTDNPPSLNNPPSRSINTDKSYLFDVTGNTLILKDTSGVVVRTFTK